MKCQLTFALGVLLLTTCALAAQQTTPPLNMQQPALPTHRHHALDPEHQAKHLAKKLNLTPDQTAKLEPILANRDTQMRAIHSNGQLTQSDAREQMRALHKSTDHQLATVLTPDQFAQLKALHRGPHGHGSRGGAGQNPPTPEVSPSV